MNAEKQRIAIAEACGWTVSEKGWWSHPTLPDNGGAEPEPPDYLNDLNACHEMEKTIPKEKQLRFYYCLGESVNSFRLPEDINFWMIHATAPQRAEAFLRTIGKWKDGE